MSNLRVINNQDVQSYPESIPQAERSRLLENLPVDQEVIITNTHTQTIRRQRIETYEQRAEMQSKKADIHTEVIRAFAVVVVIVVIALAVL